MTTPSLTTNASAATTAQIERAEELESMDMAQMSEAEVLEWNAVCHLIGQRPMNPRSPKLIRNARSNNYHRNY